MALGITAHRTRAAFVSVVATVVLALVATMTGAPPASAEDPVDPPSYTVVAASAEGDAWDSLDGGTGTAVATYGHVGCTALTVQRTCAGGVWGQIPDAEWIWRSRLPDFTKNEATFTKTFTVTAGQAAQPGVLRIAADNLFTAQLNGSEVVSGSSFIQPESVPVTLVPGTNTFTIQVTNQLNGRPPTDNPAGVSWAILAGDTGEVPPPSVPYNPPLADAGPDQQVPEGSVVTLDGSGSRASSEPSLEASEKLGTLPGGTSMGIRIAGLDAEAEGLRLTGGVEIGQGPPAQNTSLAYVIDVSGSAGFGGGCGGDANGDRVSNTVLDCEIAAALKLHEEVVASGTVDKVALIRFSSSASAVDLDPTSTVATMVSPTADKDADGVLDFAEALLTLRSGGGTYFLAPASMACSMLATTGSPNLLSAFLSDGQGSGRFSSVVPCDPPVEFQAFAVGSGSRCDGGGSGSRLTDLANLTGGACTNVPTVTDLPDILPGVIASRITKVEYAVDGGDPVDVSEQLGLPVPGPQELDLALDLPDTLAGGTHEICVTVTGEDAGGSSSETTCSDLVKVTGEIGYSWRLVSSEGPPAFLSSRTTPNPTFVAPDDGRYVFELNVSDGSGMTASDQVVVAVGNVDPVLEVVPGDSYVGGVTQVNGTLTDAGWQDTHRAVVDWGDGTTHQVPVTTAGAGWGTFFASHVYRAPGAFDVVVTLHDDDGGQHVARLDQLQVQSPVAVWANSTSVTDSLDWSGGAGRIEGRVHTNGELRFVGAEKSVRGPTTYAGPLSADTAKNSFVPAPVQAPVEDFPFRPEIADFRPGGPVAQEVGAAYRDMSAACVDGSWHEVQAPLASGVYYADCDIMLNGSDIGGRVTLVSEAHVKIGGSRPAFEPFHDGLFVVAGATGDKAIDISASTSKFLGVLFAGAGEISISGASNRFYCGILGDRVDISGRDASVRGASCGRPDSTVSGPVLVPELSTAITADKAEVLPSDRISYGIEVTNGGSTLVVPSLVGLENVDAVDATITGWTFAIERRDATTGAWEPIAENGDPALQVTLRSNPFPGVTYPAAGGVAGTVVAPGGWATWGLQAVLDLSPDLVRSLLDPASTSGLRTRVDFSLAPDGVQARRLYSFGHDFVDAMRALSADATDATVTAILPDGDALRLQPTDTPELAGIAPGETVSLSREWQVPVPAARGEGETDAGYLARLLALDGTDLNAAAFALAEGGVGRLVAPLARTTSKRTVPVVGVSTTGPAEVPAGTSGDYALKLANLGSAGAAAVAAHATADGDALTVTGAPTALAAGELGEARTTYAAPTGATGSVDLRGAATWQDARGNTYGETGSTLEVTRLAPAQLLATLTDALHTDRGGDGAVSPGDVVRYTLTVRNGGNLPLSGIAGTVDIDPNAAPVAGAATTPQGGTVQVLEGDVSITLPDIAGGGARAVTFDVTVADPFPSGVSRITAQGTTGASGLPNQATDDPALPGAADPTRTTVSQPRPALSATLGGRLVVDADGSGVVSPGDTLAYTLSISSVGTQEVTGVGVVVPTPAGTTVVAGSVATSQGTVGAGPDVSVAVGTLAPFQEATVTFRLQIADPVPAGVTSIVASGVVTSDQLDPLQTDDPVTLELGDAHTIPIGDPATNPERPGPTVSDVAPEDGVVVTAPVHVTATLAPPDGTTLSGWSVYYRLAGDAATTEIGSGTGATVDALLDPTVMPNGTYVVTVRGTTSDGGVSAQELTVVVDGDMKLGRYQTTITDLTVGVAGLPIQVNRTYDSFDKADGDFGIGWNVSLANFRVAANGPLGEGGWTMQGCGSGLIFVPLCFTTSRPHFVTVTWPDGRNEIFDLTPAQGSTFFSGLTTAAFTGRPGTTSTLSSPDNGLYFSNGNLNAGFFGSEGVYDPKSFVLTDRFGTKYHLTVGVGLTRIVDRAGDTTTFGPNGITSSRGPSVVFERDPQGRIKKITDPAGQVVAYGYDAAGDLVSVTDQRGVTSTLGYLPGHYLESVDGPDGARMATYEYTDGRITAVVDGEGNRTAISSDPSLRQETVTDPGGKRTTISSYDADGHLVKVNEVYGGADHVTTYAYDGEDNLVLRRDPTGGEWRATYDDGNITSLRLPSGAQTSVTYNDFGAPLTWTDAEGHVTTYAWNSDGTLASITDPLGKPESYSYTDGMRTGKVDRNGKVWAWTYTSAGLLATERDPLGNVTTHEYDANGRETAVVDALGHRTETTYDAAGNVRTTKDPDGRVTENAYDELNRLVRTIDPAGAVVDQAYDAAGRVVRIDNHVDLPTLLAYDAPGRLTSRRTGSGAPATTTYDGAGNVLTSTDEVGRVTTYTYYPDGKVHTVENAAGGVTTYTYTPDGQVATVTDPLGNVTTHAYWPTGRLKSTTNPLGETTRYDYDPAGRPTVTTLPDDTTKQQQYDASGRLVKQIDAEGDTTLFEYDAAGRQIASTDGEGRRTVVSMDAAGRATQVEAPDGGITRFGHTAAGLLESQTTAQGVTTTYAYDAAGRRASTSDELGHTWSTTYDTLGRVLAERDPRQQGAGLPTVANAYDDFGNLASTTDALGNRVSFGYDAAGQRTSVTDPRGKTWSVTYDAFGEVQSETDPLDRVRNSVRDTAGLLRSTTDPRGVVVDYGYDDAGRVTSVAERNGAGSIEYSYDALGRRTSMTDATGQTTWEHHPDGATRTVTSPAGAVSYTYDRSGLRTAMTTPDGTVRYSYDGAGRLDTATDAAGGTFDVGFDSDGRIASLMRPNGVATTWAYDDASRLTGITHRRGSTVVDSASYELDADGNRTRLTTPDGVETYTLNAVDQLTAVGYPDGSGATYTYDAAGNRATVTSGSAAPVAYAYDDASQLTSVGGSPVTHDAAGNVTSVQGTSYDWDWLGRMVGADGPAVPGGAATYAYDGDGVRVGQDLGSGQEALLYDRVTSDGVPDLVRSGDEAFLHLVDGVVEVDGSAMRYPLADGLGSVSTVTAADGSVVGSTRYEVFGAVAEHSGESTPFGFTGAPQAGELVHLNARDLNTTVGRFLSTDPVRPGAPGSVGWNQYTYVANNPTTLVDPSGAMAAGYAISTRPIIIALPALLPLAFAIVKPLVLTGAVIGAAALIADRTMGPEDDTDTDNEVDPDDQPVPVPFPVPLPGGDTVNKPRPGDCTINGASWYNYWGPTSRPMGADACLKAPLSTGTGPSYDPPGWQPNAGYHRGHIIARRLGGKGSMPGLFTQCAHVNSGAMRVFEGQAAAVVAGGETVYYVVALGYFGRVIPDTVSIFYAGSRGSADAETFSNVC